MEWIKSILKQGEAFIVGGSVRDQLLGIKSNDIDILVTGIDVDTLEEILKPLGKLKEVGKDFGIIIFTPHGSKETFEIALPRTEESTGRGHKDFRVHVDHNLPIEADLKRRDFTINAMAKCIRTGRLIDPWGGKFDINIKCIRQVFENTFAEDPLRILRAARFASQLGFAIDDETKRGMAASADRIKDISAERIFQELNKILKTDEPSDGFRVLNSIDALNDILPELSHLLLTFHMIDRLAGNDLHVMWSALLCEDDSTTIRNILFRLKAPTDLINKVLILAPEVKMRDNPSDFEIRRLIQRTGRKLSMDVPVLCAAIPRTQGQWGILASRIAMAMHDGAFTIKELAVSGNDLMDIGVPQGPQCGAILKGLLEDVILDPSQNNKKELLDIAVRFI